MYYVNVMLRTRVAIIYHRVECLLVLKFQQPTTGLRPVHVLTKCVYTKNLGSTPSQLPNTD